MILSHPRPSTLFHLSGLFGPSGSRLGPSENQSTWTILFFSKSKPYIPLVQVVQVKRNINAHARARVGVLFVLLFDFIKKCLDHLDPASNGAGFCLDQPPGPAWTTWTK
jgi:hypothetical protein